MGGNTKAQELRDLLSLARKLREFAAQTSDPDYIGLFLRTAGTLEARAHAIAHGTPQPPAPRQIDMLC